MEYPKRTAPLLAACGTLAFAAFAAFASPSWAQDDEDDEETFFLESVSSRDDDPDSPDDCVEDLGDCGEALTLDDVVSASTGPWPELPLTPYFDDEHPYTRARDAVGQRRCDDALTLLDGTSKTCAVGSCDARNAIDLLRAEALLCAGSVEEAAALLEELHGRPYPGMEPEVRALVARAYRKLGRDVPQWPSPTSADDPDGYVRATLAEAISLARQGKPYQAIARLEQLRAQTSSSRIRRRALLTEAKIRANEDDLAGASAIYYRLWRNTPGSDLADTMDTQLASLAGAAKKKKLETPISQLGAEDRLDRLSHITRRDSARAGKRYLRAYRRLGGIAARGSERRAQDLFVTGLGQEADRKRDKAEATLRRAAQATKDPRLLARIRFARARALRRLNRDDEAIALYRRIVEETPRSHVADDGLLVASRLLTYQGRYKPALEGVAELVAMYPGSSRMPDALWMGAWAAWLDGDHNRSLALLSHLSEHHGRTRERSGLTMGLKADYWRGRNLSRLGRRDEAIAQFRFVIERHPGTWYAALAHHQIAAHGVPPEAAVPFSGRGNLVAPTPMDGVVVGHPRVRRALELWRLGRRGAARDELWEQLRFGAVPQGVVELLATSHFVDDNIPTCQWLAWRHGDFRVAPHRGNVRLWALAHPRPDEFFAAARKEGEALGVDPYLSLAIMKHESAFKPKARSGVGARGLMQLMPATARGVNKVVFRGKGPGTGALMRPSTNIKMGTAMLHLLDNYFGGNLPLMVAAYNAGPGHAARWWRDTKGHDTDEVVELMTFPGTVAYVKQVIGSYYAYRLLYADASPPPIALTTPESLGEWDRDPDLVSWR